MYRKIEGWPRHSQNSVWNLMHESESGALCSPIVGGQHFKPPKGGWYQDVSPSLQIFKGATFLFSQQIWNLPMKFGVPLDDLMLEFSINLHVDVRNRCHPSNYRVTQAAYRWFLASQLMEKRQHLGKKRMCRWFDSDLWKIHENPNSHEFSELSLSPCGSKSKKKAKRLLRLNCTITHLGSLKSWVYHGNTKQDTSEATLTWKVLFVPCLHWIHPEDAWDPYQLPARETSLVRFVTRSCQSSAPTLSILLCDIHVRAFEFIGRQPSPTILSDLRQLRWCAFKDPGRCSNFRFGVTTGPSSSHLSSKMWDDLSVGFWFWMAFSRVRGNRSCPLEAASLFGK